MPLTNQQLDAVLNDGGTPLSLWLIRTLQTGEKIDERWKQLRWRWLSNTVYWRTRKHYKRHDSYAIRLYNMIQWYDKIDHQTEGLDRHTERILALAEFISNYPLKEGEYQHPLTVMSAYRFRFHWLEIIRQYSEKGVHLPQELARDIPSYERLLGAAGGSVDKAVALRSEEMLNKCVEWMRRGSVKSEPQYPTDKVMKGYRQKLVHYIKIREMMSVAYGLDDMMELNGWRNAW